MSGFSADGFYLALETSGALGSVAVAKGADVLGRVLLESRREHAARLVPAVERTLEEAGVDLDELDGVAVGEGPGSFTGVRVAAATAKGLVRALDVPLWAVSSLAAAAAHEAGEGPSVRYVLFDARGDRVYGGCYGLGSRGLETLVPPHAGTLRDVLASDVPPGAVFVGGGARRHRHAIQGAGFAVGPETAGVPSADGVLAVLEALGGKPPVEDPETWEPRYLRDSAAEPTGGA